MREWIDVLTRAVEQAQKVGHLRENVNPTRLVYEIHGLAMGAHWAYQLLEDRRAYSRAREAVLEKLRSLASPQAPRLP
jgi:hypothetical protein